MTDNTPDELRTNMTRRTAIQVMAFACWVMAHELASLTGEDAQRIWRTTPGSGTGREIMRGRRTTYADHSAAELLELWHAGVDKAFDNLAHAIADRTPTGKGHNGRAASKRAGDVRARYLRLVNSTIEQGGAKLSMGRPGGVFVQLVYLPSFELDDYCPE